MLNKTREMVAVPGQTIFVEVEVEWLHCGLRGYVDSVYFENDSGCPVRFVFGRHNGCGHRYEYTVQAGGFHSEVLPKGLPADWHPEAAGPLERAIPVARAADGKPYGITLHVATLN